MRTLSVVELFAGVGGFRLGLEQHQQFKVIWSNQWEPTTKAQHASKVYEARFGSDNHSNEDIATVSTQDIPDHDVLVGGFPCQDYSVATTLNNSKGLKGKKGVLWWSIYRILEEKQTKPSYLIFENVDRLLKSPASQRGRDFAVMLQSLHQLGYTVEWRVINAADYGMPQRRRRIFFIGYHQSTAIYQHMQQTNSKDWLTQHGTLAQAFATDTDEHIEHLTLSDDVVNISQHFNQNGKKSPFENTGLMISGEVYTAKTTPRHHGEKTVLGDILQPTDTVDASFFIPELDQAKWQYLKGAKKEKRTTKAGYEYNYSEGSMTYPDALDRASRTIITGEGGKSPSRFKHVVTTNGQLRRLTPLELERLNMFPDNHTQLDGISDSKRAFFMGNALVVGVVKKIGGALITQIQHYDDSGA